MANIASLEDRDALYYPYVHIRDDDWLKRTLLVFPRMARMIADDFTPNDGELLGFVVHGIASINKVRRREEKSPFRYLSDAAKRGVVISVGA